MQSQSKENGHCEEPWDCTVGYEQHRCSRKGCRDPSVPPGLRASSDGEAHRVGSASLVSTSPAWAPCVNIDESILREMAQNTSELLDVTDFVLSSKWIDRFRKRHRISYCAVSGEASSIDQFVLKSVFAAFDRRQLLSRDVFNVDDACRF